MRLLTTFFTFLLFCCQVNSQSISTLNLTQNDEDEGVMFDVFIKNDTVLNGITAQLESDNQNYNIHIYYKVGSYNTSPMTQGDWTFFASTGTISSDAAGNPTVLPLGGATANLLAGTTYGFYIENVLNSNNLDLNDGITSGTMAADNALATIFSGHEIDGNGSGTISFSGLDNPNKTFIGELFFGDVQDVAQVPTLSQWAIIILALLLIIFVTNVLTQKKAQQTKV